MAKYNEEKWIGQKFGMLTIIEPVHKEMNNGSSQWFWHALCKCGNEHTVKPFDAIKGRSVSCGCYRKSGKQVPCVHHKSRTRLHKIWCGINNRCNPENKNSERYGKRGISICNEWSDFLEFEKWAIENEYEDSLTIERIDVDGDYCPKNCKWISLGLQARNRRTTFLVLYNGRQMSLAEAAELAGLPYKQVHYRIKKRGWTVEKALSEPMKRESDLHIKCNELGLNYHTVYNRVRMGWSEKDAINIPILGHGANQTSYKR